MKFIVNGRFLTQPLTGVQRFALEISRELRHQSDEFSFLCPPGILHREEAEILQAETIGRLGGHFWEQLELPQHLRRAGKPLLINFGNTAPLAYQPKIITVHDLAFLRHPEWFSRAFALYYRFLIPRIARTALKIITVSEFSRNEIIDLLKVSSEKVVVVQNAVSPALLRHLPDAPPPPWESYILAVASMNPRKNLLRLIEAFHFLKLPNLKLVIVGTSSSIFASTGLEEQIGERENIIFFGSANDVQLASLYRYARALVFPSLYEGFGLPPLEAMACGCPVVCSNVASLPEVCGEAALYVNPLDVDDIARGIREILTDDSLRESLIERGKARAAQFSWEQSARKLIQIINNLI